MQERLSALPDGKLAYRMKRRLGDGRDVLILEPRELLRRLATLVPPPRAHLVRYHGVFAPASRWCSQVIPPLPERAASAPPCTSAPRRSEDMAPAVTETAGDDLATARPQRPAGPSRIPWAELLLRVFREDVLLCPCGGRRVGLAFGTEKKVVKGILEPLGLPTPGPPVSPPRICA